MKKKLKQLIALGCLLLFLSQDAGAQYPGTNLRGQVMTNYFNQAVPYTSAKVDLFYFDRNYPVGKQWRLIASTYTDVYGFYYFRQVIPNYYTIWVNQSKSFNVQVVPINYNIYTYQDIPRYFF